MFSGRLPGQSAPWFGFVGESVDGVVDIFVLEFESSGSRYRSIFPDTGLTRLKSLLLHLCRGAAVALTASSAVSETDGMPELVVPW